ncbi:MAG: N-acetylmuramoyl-L-alanine amidase [Desulfobulbaceae bacterium]|nr:N-acetylmuramoyl-L-alanine amidase [Desulfobulbaceae bacterium]
MMSSPVTRSKINADLFPPALLFVLGLILFPSLLPHLAGAAELTPPELTLNTDKPAWLDQIINVTATTNHENSPGSASLRGQFSDTVQLYKAAKDYYYRLERDTELGEERSNWLSGVRNFRRIYLAGPKEKLAPSCLYMMGRMYRRMYQRFKLPIDLDESINYFQKLAAVFPKNNLADDALFVTADIYQNEKNDPAQAAKMYIKIVKSFPAGDKYAQAINRLKELAKTRDIPLPDQLTRSNTLHNLVNVLPVNYWSSADYTRVVVRTTAPVHYSTSLLEKDGDQPRRLYIDFSQSYIPPELRSPIPIEDGLLQQVRTGQFNDSTVRVVLDIESISDYKVFSLNDPFRVVVDVRGIKKVKPGPPAATTPVVEQSKKTPAIGETRQPTPHPFITLKDSKKRKPAHRQPTVASTKNVQLSLAQQLGLGIRKIVLDPGHGGKDPGAMAFGTKEKDIVLKVAKKLADILQQEYKYEVQLTRNTDTFLPLEERTAIANTSGADLFVSIHVNAHPNKSARGVETFYLNLATNAEAMRVAARENATSTHNISDMQNILSDLMQNSKILESSRLAEFVQANMISGLAREKYSVKDLGVKQAPFYVLIGAEMPAILAEISFITNPDEVKLLKTDAYLEDIAHQIAAGVAAYVENHTTAAVQL